MAIPKENVIFGLFLAGLAGLATWAVIKIRGNNKVIKDTTDVLKG